ncbi:MAG: PBP1A family penicillin-binding protein [Patescibacteria group bacterium]|nr:PBP1A family penicillin-binding protein [Patescibacteria group bacterium]
MRYLSRPSALKKRNLRYKLIPSFLIISLSSILVFLIFLFVVFAWYAKDLPSPSKLSSRKSYSTIFLDRHGQVLYEMYQEKNQIPVSLADVPDHLRNATIAIEDKNFYQHSGISELGMIRAIINTFLGRGLQGGSTITQQLIKNVLLTPERSLSRKIKEIILAYEVERRYTKDEILMMYLNESPYGGTFWGVASASKGYFGKEVKNLTLLESAILAGLPQAPSVYSPFVGKNDVWKQRTKDVLRRMREDGHITKQEEDRALQELKNYRFASSPKITIYAPHFVFYVKEIIEKEYGSALINQGAKIKTTLDLSVQRLAEKIVKEEITKLKKFNVTNGAVIVLDSKTGEILAMVGSYDFNDEKYGKFNAALGLRQPGSTVKPITYAVAFEKGFTPATVLMDVKTEFSTGSPSDQPYTPVNYDQKFRGPVQVRFALGNSINVPAVKMLAIIGLKDFMQKAYEMGLTQFDPNSQNLKRFGLSLTLGGGETTLLDLTRSFSVFADGGQKKEISSILEITDFSGKTIFKLVKTRKKQVISPEVAFLISHILSDNNARLEVFGPNSYLNISGKVVAVKTGTTDDKRDNWAIGYTKAITVGVWVGNNDNSKMDPRIASGATGASPIFHKLMKELLKKYPDGIMNKPEKIKAVEIDAFLGGLPKVGFPTRIEYFIEGTEPKDISPYYKKLKISKNTGRLANEIEIKNRNYEEREFIVITENDPISMDGRNRWQEGIDSWAREQEDSRFRPPTETSDHASEEIIVSIKNPQDRMTLSSNNLEIRAKITSVTRIKNILIKINDQEIKSINQDTDEIRELISLPDGLYVLKVVATNEKEKTGQSTVRFGINRLWEEKESTPTSQPQ